MSCGDRRRSYRFFEKLAKQAMPTWRFASKHSLDVFLKAKFPINVDSQSELYPLLDTMQEGRFPLYMESFGGVSEDELDSFVEVGKEFLLFLELFFPNKPLLLPCDTLISAFSLVKRILQLHPDPQHILEIGAGCGYTSFFIAHVLRTRKVKTYTQIEACESFYLLQDLVNTYLFGHKFTQMAYSGVAHPVFSPKLPETYQTLQSPTLLRNSKLEEEKICFQYPWWKLKEIEDSHKEYEVITSNANLAEFSEEALWDYLTLIQNKLTANGIFLVQCFGCGDTESIWEVLFNFGFRSLFTTGNVSIDTEGLVKSIPDEVSEIVLAPASFVMRNLVRDKLFRSRFKRVVFADNHKAGSKILGCDVVSPHELSRLDIQASIVVHQRTDFCEGLKTIIEGQGIEVLNTDDCIRRHATEFGVFISRKHERFSEIDSYDKFF